MKIYTIEEAKLLFNLNVKEEGIYEIRTVYQGFVPSRPGHFREWTSESIEIYVVDNDYLNNHGNGD